VGEAPIVLLGVEEVRDFPRKVFFLVAPDLELGRGLATPGGGLGLAVALQEVAHALGGALVAGAADLPWHDHDLPGQVANECGRRQHRFVEGGEVSHGEGEGGLRTSGVLVIVVADVGRCCRCRRRDNGHLVDFLTESVHLAVGLLGAHGQVRDVRLISVATLFHFL